MLVATPGCTDGRAGRTPAPSATTLAATPLSAQSSTSGALSSRLVGKFTAGPIVFEGNQLGLVTITGFVGASSEVSSWQERTTDGGRTWVAGPVAHTSEGRYPPPVATTQIGLAFTSATTGWAYQPALFHTQDGGVDWAREPGAPAGVGAVAVQGSSTWITGYPCRSFDCQATIYQADRVGGPLRPLASQPAATGDITALLRTTRSTATVIIEASGRRQLITTVDAGHHWHQVRQPCGADDTLSLSGNASSGIYLLCAEASHDTCGGCGAHVLYRSSDAGSSWTRITPSPTPPYSFTTPDAFVQPVTPSIMWAVHSGFATSAAVLRSVTGGRGWRQVLSGTSAHPLAVDTFFASDSQHAWVVTTDTTATGSTFTVERTSNGGRSWDHSTLPIPPGAH